MTADERCTGPGSSLHPSCFGTKRSDRIASAWTCEMGAPRLRGPLLRSECDYKLEHCPIREPVTVFGFPSLVGAGVLPVQDRDPPMVLPSISARVSSGNGPVPVVPAT